MEESVGHYGKIKENKMKVALCCDHGGLALKNAIVGRLKDFGCEAVDYGTTTCDSCDYPDFALKAAEAVANGECERGIFICTTLCARLTREHNDANVLALGGGIVGINLALEIVETFLKTPFSNLEKHQRRINKIKLIEEKYGK